HQLAAQFLADHRKPQRLPSGLYPLVVQVCRLILRRYLPPITGGVEQQVSPQNRLNAVQTLGKPCQNKIPYWGLDNCWFLRCARELNCLSEWATRYASCR